MLFEVRALNTRAEVTSVIVEAEDDLAARRLARERALKPLGVRPAGRARSVGASRFSLGMFSQELLSLLEAGLSITEALDSMHEKAAAEPARDVASRLAQEIRSGQRLSHAMQAMPDCFPPVFLGLMQAAETTSNVATVLARYVEYENQVGALRSKAASAAIYPAILCAVGGSVTLFLLGYVVPRFASVYDEAGRSVSWLTSLLLSWGNFIGAHTLMLASIAGVLAALAFLAVLGLRRRVTAVDLLSGLPWVRGHARAFEMSRLYMTTGLLLSGGIPLVRALRLVEPTLRNESRARLGAAARNIASGVSFSDAMASERLTDPVSLRLFRVGEQTGDLGGVLLRAARYLDGEVTRFIDRFTRVAEPIVMAVIGVVVGTIVILLYMPIFELAGTLQ